MWSIPSTKSNKSMLVVLPSPIQIGGVGVGVGVRSSGVGVGVGAGVGVDCIFNHERTLSTGV